MGHSLDRMYIRVPGTTALAIVLLCGTAAACGGSHRYGEDGSPGSDTLSFGCNVLTQNCDAGARCTWVAGGVASGLITNTECLPDTTVRLGEPCNSLIPGATTYGYDDCSKGSFCRGGICKEICDLSGGAPTCNGNSTCVAYADLFLYADGTNFAGICEATAQP